MKNVIGRENLFKGKPSNKVSWFLSFLVSILKPVWNLYVLYSNLYETWKYLSCLVLSCLTPDFCLALICLDFVYLYKRGVLYAQTVLAQILSFVIIPLTRPQAAPNVTLVSEVG